MIPALGPLGSFERMSPQLICGAFGGPRAVAATQKRANPYRDWLRAQFAKHCRNMAAIAAAHSTECDRVPLISPTRSLEPKGVPENLRDTVYPFSYNNFAELEELVNKQDIGVIKMEVSRSMCPEDNFLHKVRKLASEKNIVLIFDECTSGFRQSFGGLHKIYGVEPDMAVFGKALGNGYAITAVIGQREVMEVAQSTFISSTFWTERIGPVAALKTLEIMEKEKSWEQVTQTGRDITAKWKTLADKYNLSITTSGLPALTSFVFDSVNSLAYKTLITQEMQANGYLAGNSIYACTAHSPEIVASFFERLDPIFGLIEECEEGRDIMSLLKGPVCHGGFKRLN